MTAQIYDIQGDHAVLAVDTLVTGAMDRDRLGHTAKLFPLPHVGAVLGCTPYAYITRQVVADAAATAVRDLAHLREVIQDPLQRHHHEFVHEVGPEHGMDFDTLYSGCMLPLAVPGDVWVFMDDFDFRPLPVSRAGKRCMIDPELDGTTEIPGGLRGDDHLLHLMRRQRAETERGVGGRCIKATVGRDGIDVRDVGDVEVEPGPGAAGTHAEKPGRASGAAPTAKVGRNDPCPCGSGRKAKRCCGAT